MLLRLAWQFLRDPRVPLRRKLVASLPFLYILLPFDLRPDWIPIIGWFDDVIALGIGITVLWWLTRGYRRKSPETKPPSEEDKTVEGKYRIIK